MHRERAVVTAAVFRVQHKAHVQNLCFEFGILPVGAQKVQNIFGDTAARQRLMYDKAVVAMEMTVRVIAVNADHRHFGNELQALP